VQLGTRSASHHRSRVWGSRSVRIAGLLQHPFPPDPNTCSRGRNASHHRRHYRGQRSRESGVSWPWAIRDSCSCREWAPAALWVQCLAPCRPWVAPTVSAVTDSPSAARGTMSCIFRTERAPAPTLVASSAWTVPIDAAQCVERVFIVMQTHLHHCPLKCSLTPHIAHVAAGLLYLSGPTLSK
jgi:hypothetical protein